MSQRAQGAKAPAPSSWLASAWQSATDTIDAAAAVLVGIPEDLDQVIAVGPLDTPEKRSAIVHHRQQEIAEAKAKIAEAERRIEIFEFENSTLGEGYAAARETVGKAWDDITDTVSSAGSWVSQNLVAFGVPFGKPSEGPTAEELRADSPAQYAALDTPEKRAGWLDELGRQIREARLEIVRQEAIIQTLEAPIVLASAAGEEIADNVGAAVDAAADIGETMQDIGLAGPWKLPLLAAGALGLFLAWPRFRRR